MIKNLAARQQRMVGKAQAYLDHLLATNPVVDQIKAAEKRLAVAEAGDFATYRDMCRKAGIEP